MMTNVYAIAQQKGGVGKTTTTINLGAALAEKGYKVLLVDLDPQGALSAGLGVDSSKLDQTIYNVLRSSRPNAPSLKISDVLQKTSSGCDLAPANIDLSASELELVSEPARERVLKEKLSEVLPLYNYILIDCPPSLSLLTLNALAAASKVIIPVQTQYFALRGMDLLLETIRKIQSRINSELKIAGILPTLYDSRTKHSKEVLTELQQNYGSMLFQVVIPSTVKLPDSAIAGESILQYTPGSPATEAYRNLAKEIIVSE